METKSVLAALAALAQETRLAIYRLLVEHAPEGLTAGQVAGEIGAPAATLSFHFKELVHAGLIDARPEGRFIWYTANLDAMNGVVAYLTENCCRSSAVCDPKCAPKAMPLAEIKFVPPKRRRSA